jgi:hypothetical protein
MEHQPAAGVTGPVYTVSVATVGTYTFTITDKAMQQFVM